MKSIWYFLFLLLLISCKEQGINTILTHEMKAYEERRCVEDVCATIKLSYPLYLGQEVESSINEEIERLLIKSIVFEEPVESLALAVSNYLDAFEKFAVEYGSFSEWFIEIQVEETFQNDELLTILINSSSFLGGAHPNYYQNLLNFDIQKGGQIPLKGLKINLGKLFDLVEEKFKAYHEVPEGISLEEDGRFFLKNDKDFFLPMNMGFDNEGLVVIYNPYEIGPYTLGMTVIQIFWDELEGIASAELKLK
jgi:hypothetical protein